MKRKPIHILAGLINAMNSLDKDHKYSINEIHEKTEYHWTTVSDYVKLIILAKKFAPDLKIDEKSKGIIITNQSPYFKKFNLLEQLILYLFISKAFNEESAIKKNKIIFSDGSKLNPSEEFITETSNRTFYLTLKGKFKAQGILASIYSEMGDYIENNSKIHSKKSKVWLLNFYENETSSLKNKMRSKIESEQKVEQKSNELDEYQSLFATHTGTPLSGKISNESIA